MKVIKAFGDGKNPEYFQLKGLFTPGKWQFSVRMHTGGAKYISQASGEFDLMVDLTWGEYTMPLKGKISAHNTGINVDYAKMIVLTPDVYIYDPTNNVQLAVYPNSVVSPLVTDYALGVLIDG